MPMRIRSFENRAFITLVVLVTLAFAWTVQGLLLPIFWAVVLAVLFSPLYHWFSRRLRAHATVAALLTLLTVLVLVIGPLVGLGATVTAEALGVYDRVTSGEIDLEAPIEAVEQALPSLTRRAEELGVDVEGAFQRARENVAGTAVTVGQAVAGGLLDIGQQTVRFTLLLAVTLYVLFFFVRDGDRLVEVLVRALPLGDPRERRLLTKFAAVTRATVKGTFVIAAVQGAIGGVTFALLGLGSPVLWGVVMAVFSLLPAVGGAIVWVPAAVYLALTGAWVKALVLTGVGVGIMGTVDNALRPVLVGRDAGMPDYMILLSTLGGLATFGFSGLVIGPVVAGLFLTVWELFTEEFGPADTSVQVPGETPREAAADEDHPAELDTDPEASDPATPPPSAPAVEV